MMPRRSSAGKSRERSRSNQFLYIPRNGGQESEYQTVRAGRRVERIHLGATEREAPRHREIKSTEVHRMAPQDARNPLHRRDYALIERPRNQAAGEGYIHEF